MRSVTRLLLALARQREIDDCRVMDTNYVWSIFEVISFTAAPSPQLILKFPENYLYFSSCCTYESLIAALSISMNGIAGVFAHCIIVFSGLKQQIASNKLHKWGIIVFAIVNSLNVTIRSFTQCRKFYAIEESYGLYNVVHSAYRLKLSVLVFLILMWVSVYR